MVATPVETQRPLRRAEYDTLVASGAFADERIELLDGALAPMSPIAPPHSSAVQKLTELLLPALLGRATVRVQSPFAALELSEPEPDLAVVPPGDYDEAHPHRAYLIIEVAESSLLLDRTRKSAIYATSGVPEYWIGNLSERCIEVYSNPEGAAYVAARRVEHSEALHPAAFPELELRVADVLK